MSPSDDTIFDSDRKVDTAIKPTLSYCTDPSKAVSAEERYDREMQMAINMSPDALEQVTDPK